MSWKRTAPITVLLVALAALVWWLLKPSQTPQGSSVAANPGQSASPSSASSPILPLQASGSAVPSQPIDERRKAVVENILGVLATPITFYGKVIDQNGNPVPDAAVGYSALDKFMAPGTGYTGTSDENGKFSISDIKGARLSVNVRKNGYYFIDGKSNAAFAYGTGSDGYFQNPPTKENPAIFILQKMGTTESLIRVSSRQIDVPRTGQPMSINLATGRTGQGNLQVTSWIGDSKQRPFDWRYHLSVPGGGLIERKGQFDFEAPADGYQPTIEVNMAANAEQWTARLTKEYFAKLGDGKYARFSVRFYAGDRNFVVLESYLNPILGSRNLEFDPTKVVKSP